MLDRLDKWIDNLIFRVYGKVTPGSQAFVYILAAVIFALIFNHFFVKG